MAVSTPRSVTKEVARWLLRLRRTKICRSHSPRLRGENRITSRGVNGLAVVPGKPIGPRLHLDLNPSLPRLLCGIASRRMVLKSTSKGPPDTAQTRTRWVFFPRPRLRLFFAKASPMQRPENLWS